MISRIRNWLGLGLAMVFIWLGLGLGADAFATNPVVPPPAALFETNCAGCHLHGGNIIRRGKTLKLNALVKNGYDTTETIAELITHGKGNMSAYQERLSATEIQSLAAYVLEQAQQNWQDS
jgi:cytochrome c6